MFGLFLQSLSLLAFSSLHTAFVSNAVFILRASGVLSASLRLNFDVLLYHFLKLTFDTVKDSKSSKPLNNNHFLDCSNF